MTVVFSSRLTSTAIQLDTSKKTNRLLPPLTVCPTPAYKTKGIFPNNQTYLQNTFSMEEIFAPSTIDHLKGENPFFSITEIWSFLLGRCYLINM
jgi:hypothetical protein